MTFVAALILSGCASSSIVVGKTRPAIDPSEVKVYIRAPKKYEEVALIEASSKGSFSFGNQGKMNKVVERLKNEAAAIGANGVLIQGTGSEQGGSVGTGTGSSTISGNSVSSVGFGVSAGILHKAGNGIAIYVIEE